MIRSRGCKLLFMTHDIHLGIRPTCSRLMPKTENLPTSRYFVNVPSTGIELHCKKMVGIWKLRKDRCNLIFRPISVSIPIVGRQFVYNTTAFPAKNSCLRRMRNVAIPMVRGCPKIVTGSTCLVFIIGLDWFEFDYAARITRNMTN